MFPFVEDAIVLRAQARLATELCGGRYRLRRLVGIGGMAAVYAGVHRNGHAVAIKILHERLAADPHIERLFRREAQLANLINHPGVVPVIDDDVTDDGCIFLVMPLLHGETLRARAARLPGRTLPPEEVIVVADAVLHVLEAAHAKKVVHRDIKPENIFVTTSGDVKVLDFGIGRFFEMNDGATATRSGRTVGTPAFMAPEQALGRARSVDGRTDLWALGATMFTLLSGAYVHEGESGTEVAVRAATRPARRLEEVAPTVARELAAVVDRALAFEREGRFQDATAMDQALGEALRASVGRGLEELARVVGIEAVDSQAPKEEAPGAELEGGGYPPEKTLSIEPSGSPPDVARREQETREDHGSFRSAPTRTNTGLAWTERARVLWSRGRWAGVAAIMAGTIAVVSAGVSVRRRLRSERTADAQAPRRELQGPRIVAGPRTKILETGILYQATHDPRGRILYATPTGMMSLRDSPLSIPEAVDLPKIGTGKELLLPQAVSAKGDLLIGVDEHLGGRRVNELWLAPANGSPPVHLRDGPAICGVAHHHSDIAFTAEHLGGIFVGQPDTDTRDRKVLSLTPNDTEFIDWSPDDQKIAVLSRDGSTLSVVVVSADGSSSQRVFSAPDNYPGWKRRIAWFGEKVLYAIPSSDAGTPGSTIIAIDDARGVSPEPVLDLPGERVSPLLVYGDRLVLISAGGDDGIRFVRFSPNLDSPPEASRVVCPLCIPIGWRADELLAASGGKTTVALSAHSSPRLVLDARPLAVTSLGRLLALRSVDGSCALVAESGEVLDSMGCDARVKCALHVERCVIEETRSGERVFSWLDPVRGQRMGEVYRAASGRASALLSPDATTLALVDDISIAFVDLRDGSVRNIAAEHENRGATFDPSGVGLIVAAVALDGSPFGLYTIARTGEMKGRTTEDLPLFYPVLSPDGQTLAVADRRMTNTLSEVRLSYEAR